MNVNLGPKVDTTHRPARLSYYVGKMMGRHGGVFGFGVLTPLIWAAGLVGAMFWFEGSGESALVEKPPFATPESEKLWSDNAVRIVSMIPTRLGSQIWGILTHATIPEALREHVYGLYSRMFNVIMEEVPKPLKEFRSLNEFFTRRIPMSARPVASSEFVSPVDGTVLVFGDCKEQWSEQVKGIYYSLDSLLGEDAVQMINRYAKRRRRDGSLPDLKYCVIYLAPGDYHGIHSPVPWCIQDVRHFTGHLFSVSPATSARLHGLLSVNERVCLSGTSPYGFFSMTPVGAYNVGSITLEWDPDFNTNLRHQKVGERYQIRYHEDTIAEKGDCVSFFNLGSTVVLLFEAPDSFEWKVQPHAKIKLGQPLFGSE
jgi:phosphatidylserine decarboxylase